MSVVMCIISENLQFQSWSRHITVFLFQVNMSGLKCFPMRIKPGNELKSSLLKFVKENDLKAPFVISCVGSVTKATLRMAKVENAIEVRLTLIF